MLEEHKEKKAAKKALPGSINVDENVESSDTMDILTEEKKESMSDKHAYIDED